MPAPAFAPFRPEDFRLYEPQNRSEESLNERRLQVRRKLAAVGEASQAALKKEGLALERRESLHHPFSVNHMRVVAQWTSLFRDAKGRRAFAGAVGPDLGKDVDPGHANCALFVSIDDEGLRLGLRIGVEAWYDAQNLANFCAKSDEGRRAFADVLRRSPGFVLRIHDWAKLYPTDKIGRDEIEELFKYYRPGEHRLECFRALRRDDPAACEAAFLESAAASLVALAPVYRFVAWSPENNRLLKAGGGFA